ncbi:MAG: BatA domain-containing protein, partial [Planctomycetota bacterium]|nr:BatA domain-containing protein [Planctomycetota bacterium]
MNFLHPSLLYIGLPIVALPILIHLINMMRQRKIQWAAMEFLLVSQKKNRSWIILKQLLLLLLRMAAIAAVAFMVAQPQMRNRLGNLFGGSKTHHIFLLDDSYSMSDRWANTNAFDEGKSRIASIVKQARQEPAAQEITLLRFSKAGRSGRGMQPDLSKSMEAGIEKELEVVLQGLKPSELAIDPTDALESALQKVRGGGDQNFMVYLISDFRTKDWNEAGNLRKQLLELNEAGVEPRLIACVDTARPNLAITSLRPLSGTRAAGVNLVMEVTVKNFGKERARDVSVLLEEDGQARPAEVFQQLDAGASQTRTFEVKFTTPGQHRVGARLQTDALGPDDTRYSVLDIAPSVPVLVIEGDTKSLGERGSDSFFIAQAVSPDVSLTGIRVQVETPQFLRTTKQPLSDFHAIYLLNVDRLQVPERVALEEYAAAGGGVAIFV